MLNFFRPLFEIAFFKQSPEILPASITYLYTLLAVYFSVAGGSFYLSGYDLNGFVLRFIVLVIFSGLILYGILRIMNKKERFLQAFSAKIGTNIILSIFLIPIAYNINHFPDDKTVMSLTAMGYLVSIFWSIGIYAYILQAATELKMNLCIPIAICVTLFMLMASVNLSRAMG